MDERTYILMLADGTILKGSCGLSDRSLWCWISEKTMADCFALFSDPEKTKAIDMRYTVSGIIYRGYTVLDQIRRGSDAFGHETIDIRMTWPEGGEHSVEEYEIDENREEGGAE